MIISGRLSLPEDGTYRARGNTQRYERLPPSVTTRRSSSRETLIAPCVVSLPDGRSQRGQNAGTRAGQIGISEQ